MESSITAKVNNNASIALRTAYVVLHTVVKNDKQLAEFKWLKDIMVCVGTDMKSCTGILRAARRSRRLGLVRTE